MKNILLGTLLAVVAIGAVGCQRPWFSRGASCNTCPTGIPDCTPTAPVVTGGAYIPAEGSYLPQPQG